MKRVPDELYQRTREHYDQKQYVGLVLIFNQINSWNTICIYYKEKNIRNKTINYNKAYIP